MVRPAPPTWITRHLGSISACFATQAPRSAPFAPIFRDDVPYGANMAMRRDCFRDSSFDVRLGPVGRTNYQHEDTARSAVVA